MASTNTYCSKDASGIKSSSFDAWSGHDLHHPVGYNGNYKWRSVLYFPISFTGMTTINSATLHLKASTGYHYAWGASADGTTMYVRRLTRSFGEGTNRGENVWSQNEAYNWTNNTLSDSYTSTGGVSHDTGELSDNEWQSIDITEIVKAWAPVANGGYASGTNYGIVLINSNESSVSKFVEWQTDDTSGKAYVTVDYATNTAPYAPATASMNPGSTSSSTPELCSLTPAFTGSFTDPDTGDTVSGVQVIVYTGTTQVTENWNSGTVATTSTAWSVNYAGSGLTGNSTYNWIARQKDADGAWSGWSSPMYFKPNSTPLQPTLSISQTPANNLLTLTPTFNVTHNDPDATDNKAYGYSVIIQTAAGGTWGSTGDVSLGTPITTITQTYGVGSFTGWTALTPGAGYRFQARTKDSNGAWSSYSGWYYFTIHKTGTPISLDPVQNDTVTTVTPTFTGSRASSTDTLTNVTIEVYEPSVSTVTPKDTKVVACSATGFSYVWAGATLVTGHTYTWRAKVTAQMGYGDFSSLITFGVDTSGVNLQMPTTNDGTKVTTLTPTFPFSRAVAFRYYSLEVRGNASGTLYYFSGDVDKGSSTTSATRVFNTTTGIGAGGAAASTGTLGWNLNYKWRVRVSNVSIADLQAQAYGSYTTFWTDSAGIPTLTGSNINGAWTTTATPDFGLTRFGTDTIATVQINVYKIVNGTEYLQWGSGTLDVADGTTATVAYGTMTGSGAYGGGALAGGFDYTWEARYTKTTGPIGDYSPKQSWHQNAAPDAPSALYPPSGSAVNGTNPTFRATFTDLDVASMGDYPSEWVIEILTEADVAFTTVSITNGLNAGANEYGYSGAPNMSVGTTYKWYTYFKDQKGVSGTASGVRTFLASAPPSAQITTPSDESNVASNRVDFTYAYSHPSLLPQQKYRLKVSKTSTQDEIGDDPASDVQVYDSGEQAYTVASGSNGTVTMPSGYTRTGFRYRARLYVWSTDGIMSAVNYQEFHVQTDAPPVMSQVNVAPDDARSRIRIQWYPQESSRPANFNGFRVYRRIPGADDYSVIAIQNSWYASNTYYDYYAGNNIVYEYMVTQMKGLADDTDVESPDSEIGASTLTSDDWLVVGQDRGAAHIFLLPVEDEEHERPVQQEIFEPVGSQRKVIARGAVLGNEGTLDVLWAADEVQNARIQVEYLYSHRGPHILKSPFGDVFEVEFAGPSQKYQMGGHLAMSLSYIETSMRTSDLTYIDDLDSAMAQPGTVV